MFEYHGWATIYTDQVDQFSDTDEEIQSKVISDLQILLQEKAPHARLQIRNVIWALELSGCNNHNNERIIDIFRWIAANARHSYGLLYIRDDEDSKHGQDYTNVFRVWRLAMGQLIELDDPFLSPCIPTIEPLCED
jgi:hypothetical protein